MRKRVNGFSFVKYRNERSKKLLDRDGLVKRLVLSVYKRRFSATT